MFNPESDSREKEPQQEGIERMDAFINPRFENSAQIFDTIKENIYGNERDPEEREKLVEQYGYSAEVLKRIGKDIKKELSEIYLEPDKMDRLQFLEGLASSKTGDGERDRIHHSDLSVGLASELVRQMRKINEIFSQPQLDIQKVHQILSERGLTPAPKDTFSKILEKEDEELEIRKNIMLANIPSRTKRRQYSTAFMILEKAIHPESGAELDNKKIVEHNLYMLSKDMRRLLMAESWGGNAGSTDIDGKEYVCAGANGYMDAVTGKIITFGNIQDVGPKIVEKNKWFILRVADIGKKYKIVERDGAVGVSDEGLKNLQKAIEEYNHKNKKGD